MILAGRRVVLGVSGGIACYKACTIARRLTEMGAAVDVVLSSAAVHEPALAALREAGVEIDILLPATMGRSPDYARQLVENLRPRLVVPHHFDDFWRSLDHPQAAAPSDPEDVAAFEAEIRAAVK